MSKIITTTFLLKNPTQVREMVAQGIILLVKHNGKIVMQIKVPNDYDSIKPPTFLSKAKYNSETTFSREGIYNGKFDK